MFVCSGERDVVAFAIFTCKLCRLCLKSRCKKYFVDDTVLTKGYCLAPQIALMNLRKASK